MSKERGTLKVIQGPMFAGKTTELETAVCMYEEGTAIAIKPSIDNRYSEGRLVSHDEAMRNESDVGIPAFNVDREHSDFLPFLTPAVVLVVIDEVNFFSFEVLAPQIELLLAQGIDVVAAGLAYDAFKQPFGATLELAEIADAVVELTALCECGKRAKHSYRKKPIEGQLVVGGADLYGACCDVCWHLHNPQLEENGV
ncbi:hypothetical protein C5B42_03570 [Candidatus Cerribacteria bacterium 'Amazon FNV 2010 28 9']|uniref:Thymidine kinase n=1 Tax=Candidatus Cerribacteria bacterium 'Amazon FNV 2010 28 9' TaxID=2081795 RepID=A0A317JNT3_9BACT|nr:MAG: hypothetical protein C5B42_03570 [Candidatus Cerribacteria bacterium 'Amazon FNV 2010 28 9']